MLPKAAGAPAVYDFTNSGHWPYDYKEADKVGAAGIEGGPNWAMSESMANATYRWTTTALQSFPEVT